jgi:hypothetical protein
MKRVFLIKTTIVFYLSIIFFLMWKVNTAKAFCEIQKQCNRMENHFFTPSEINSFGVFPFDDFLIKV